MVRAKQAGKTMGQLEQVVMGIAMAVAFMVCVHAAVCVVRWSKMEEAGYLAKSPKPLDRCKNPLHLVQQLSRSMADATTRVDYYGASGRHTANTSAQQRSKGKRKVERGKHVYKVGNRAGELSARRHLWHTRFRHDREKQGAKGRISTEAREAVTAETRYKAVSETPHRTPGFVLKAKQRASALYARNSFVYILSSPDYYYMLQTSLCTLRRHHGPFARVTVVTVKEYFVNSFTLTSSSSDLNNVHRGSKEEIRADTKQHTNPVGQYPNGFDSPRLIDEKKARAMGERQYERYKKDMRERLGLEVLEVDKLEFENKHTLRFKRNWLKLRLWELEDMFDGVMFVDLDVVFGANVEHLFSLPFIIGYTRDMDKGPYKYKKLQSGVIFLRPCKALFHHMLQLVESDPALQFPHAHAEQSFLDWYFKYDGFALPASYHVIDNVLRKRSRFPMYRKEHYYAVASGSLSDGVKEASGDTVKTKGSAGTTPPALGKAYATFPFSSGHLDTFPREGYTQMMHNVAPKVFNKSHYSAKDSVLYLMKDCLDHSNTPVPL